MLKDFRDFVLRGNVVELAVAVVIGAAFGSLVTQFVGSFITPLIAAIGGQPDFGDLAFTLNGARFRYGLFINALIAFLIIAAVVFFLVIRPVNLLMARFQPDTAVDVVTRPCPECLSDIPSAATRCAFCTSRMPRGPEASAPPAPEPA